MNLSVYREFKGEYEEVGVLSGSGEAASFRYASSYLSSPNSSPISTTLPLQEQAFDERATRSFFSGLIPEGSLRRDLETAARAARGDYVAVLDSVRNEPIGALIFAEEGLPPNELERAYEKLDFAQIQQIAHSPVETAFNYSMRSRISLAGAQSKVGLYHAGEDPCTGWHLPRGAAPSTHIVKACSAAYPQETISEALCLRAASIMDLPAVSCFLIPETGDNPLLAVERYDRTLTGSQITADGLPVPLRLHQEDFAQAIGIIDELKYEPTGANYLALIADVVRRTSYVANEDRYTVGYFQAFDYAVGNCDNHLKNWSLIWDDTWKRPQLAPLYDVVCTTVYPNLLREMGVSFGGSRVIDEATRDAIVQRLGTAGIAPIIANSICADTANELPDALEQAAESLVDDGFPAARDVLAKIMPGVKKRLAVLKA